MEIDVKFLRFS